MRTKEGKGLDHNAWNPYTAVVDSVYSDRLFYTAKEKWVSRFFKPSSQQTAAYRKNGEKGHHGNVYEVVSKSQ